MNKIKLLIMVKSIDGGTGTFLLNLLKIKRHFSRNKLSMKTLVLEKPSYRKIVSKDIIFFRDNNFYPQRYSLSPINFINFMSEIIWTKKICCEYKPDIILSIDLRCNLIAIFTRLFFPSIKVMITNHIDLRETISDKSSKYLYFFLKRGIGFFYNSAGAIVGVSKQLSTNLKHDFSINKNITTIYNGMEIKGGEPKFRLNDKKILITIARLVEQKDHETLIKAISLLKKKIPKIELWILSNGPKKKLLEKYVKELKLTHEIFFLGWVKDIVPYLKKADLFVFSSKREGFAYVLVESMAQGLPIVSTNTHYGPSEILEKGKYGLLVPVGKPTKFKNACYELLTNKKKYAYYSKKSIERSKYFTVDKMLKGYKKQIEKLIK